MSRSVSWSIVAWLAVTLYPATRCAVAQVPNDQPVAESQGVLVAEPAVVAPPEAPQLWAVPSDTLAPTTATVPASPSLPVVHALDAAMQEKIEAALDATAEFNFREAPLREVVLFVRETYKIPVVIDKSALDDVGLGSETPITISLQGVSLRSLLNLTLRELELTYEIRDQILKITTPEQVENKLAKRVYPVTDLGVDLPPPVVVDSVHSRYDTLVELIAAVVAPNSWDIVGGAGSVAVYDPWGLVVVSQTREAHAATAALLAAVRKVQQAMANAPASEADCEPVPVVPVHQSAARTKILQALDGIASLDFHEAPLQEVTQFLSEVHRFPILFDRGALDDVGLGCETPVTLALEGVSLRCALRLMLSELDLTYVVTDEVLKITTPEEAEQEFTTIVYPVRDFVVAPSDPRVATGVSAGLADLVDLMRSTLAPDTWSDVGGAGTMVAVDRWGLLVVSQSDQVHEEIADLLATMRRGHQTHPASAATPVGPSGALGTATPGGEAALLKLYSVAGYDVKQIMHVIEGTVAPGTWLPASQQGALFPLGGGLLIRQTPAVHAEIAELLDALQQGGTPMVYGGLGGRAGGFF